jgi:hypothetical protein
MSPITVMIVLALLGTLGALGMGIFSMLRGGEFDQRNSGRFMAARVGLQGLTVVLLLAALAMA